MKFYKDAATNKWILGTIEGYPAGKCLLDKDPNSNKISIIRESDGKVLHTGDVKDFIYLNSSDVLVNYDTYANFATATSDFFVKPAGGIESGQEVIDALGFTPADEANTLTLQVETVEYYNNLIASGGDIDAISLSAIDKFIVSGKMNGWWDAQKDMCLFLKTKGGVNSALVKLKNVANRDFINNGYLDADVKEYGLFGGAPNLTKSLDANVSFADLGMTLQNFSTAVFTPIEGKDDWRFTGNVSNGYSYGPVLGAYVNDYTESRFLIGINGGSIFGTKNAVRTLHGVDVFTGRMEGVSYYVDGITYSNKINAGNQTINGNIVLSKGRNDNDIFYGNFPLSFYSIGTQISDIQARAFSRDILELMIDLKRISHKRFGIIVGDSIGEGSNAQYPKTTWAQQICRKLGIGNLNTSRGSRSLLTDDNINGILSGNSIRNQITDLNLTDANVFFALGTNDMRNQDSNANNFGNPTILNNYYSAMYSMGVDILLRGQNITFISPAINTENATNFSPNKQLDYVKKSALAAKNLRKLNGCGAVSFVNLYHLFLDNSGYISDGVHFTENGHRAAADEIYRVMTTRSQIRKVSLNFPQIAAQSSFDLTVMVLNAEVGMSVSMSLPIALESGFIANAFVSADDTVTVRLTNITGNAITPTSGKYTIVVNTGY